MFVAIVIAMALIVIGEKAAGKGLVLGALFSVINFVLIGQTIFRTIGHSKRLSILLSLASLVLRYTILAIPLIVAVKFNQISLITTIIGIFSIQAIILWDHFHLSMTNKGVPS